MGASDKSQLVLDGKPPKYGLYDVDGDTKGHASEDISSKEKETQEVPFLSLFRYADKLDYFLIFVGTLGALGHGAAWPGTVILFGGLVEDFVDIAKFDQQLDKIPDVLAILGLTKDDVYKDPGVIYPYCGNLSALTNGNMSCDNFDVKEGIFDDMKDDALLFIYLSFGIMFCAFLQFYCYIISSERQVIRMRIAFLSNIMKQEIAWFDTHSAGELTVKLTDDVSKIHFAIGDKLATYLQWSSSCITGLTVSLVHGWELTLIMLIGSPLVILSFATISYFVTKMSSVERQNYALAGGVAEEVLSSIRTVAAFGGQNKEAERYLEKLHGAKNAGIRKDMILGLGEGSSWLIIYLSWAMAMYFGGKFVRYGDYSVADMMIVFFACLISSLSIGLAAPTIAVVSEGKAAAFEVFKIIDRKGLINSQSEVGLKPRSLKGSIRFRNIHFTYPTRKSVQVLRGLDLTVSPGKTVALVGSSGCGKSTLMQLLLRFYDPDMGEVYLDGANVRDLNIRWLRQQIGLVSQEPILFATTIAENIRYGREDVTMEEIIEASKNANAYKFIMKLPLKFETQVGERGAQLSGGQKQRIAIARALVKNPRVLLLDEATSALDTSSEAVVQEALEKASEGRTTLVIAHRLSTVRNADVIVAIDKGQVVEKGTHDELYARQGLYYQLVSNQVRTAEYESGSESDGSRRRQINGGTPTLNNKFSFDDHDDEIVSEMEDKENEKDVEELYPVLQEPLWRLFKMTTPFWVLIILGSISSLVNGGTQPMWSIILGEITKTFSRDTQEKQKDKMDELCLFTVGIAILSFLSYFGQIYFFGYIGEELTLSVRNLFFRAILRQEIGWFDDKRHETGKLTQQLASDASIVQGAVSSLLGLVLFGIGNIGAGLIISFIYSWQLALALLVFVPLMILGGYLQITFLGGAAKDSNAALEGASNNALSSVNNIRTVASLTLEPKFEKAFSVDLWNPFYVHVKTSVRGCAIFGISQGLYYWTIAVCFWYGSDLLEDRDIEYYEVIKVFACMILSSLQLGRVMAFAPEISKARSTAAKIFGLVDYVPTIDIYSNEGIQPENYKSSVAIKEALFRYPVRKEVQILNDLNVSVEPGQTLALVGESGCGKSTTVSLLERFYDLEHGSVTLGKHDIKKLNVQWLRRQIGVVSQEPVLFDTTIADNIAYGDNFREISMDEIVKAAKDANIHNFIQSLPLGYETNVGSKGTQLSGGQKQRVAIARALIRNPKILLLDEATSALDTESEKIVQEAIDKAREGRTCITIAHRLSTIKNADKIAVIDAGRVVEQGTHSELLAKRGIYYKLQTKQEEKRDKICL